MYEPGIERLRRFALTIGLVLLTYSLADISMKPDSEVSVMGIPFKVGRPELLPVGLVIASLYSMIRFYYYGFMLKKSPYRLRRDAIEGLFNLGPSFRPSLRGLKRKRVSVYFASIKEFKSRTWDEDRNKVEAYVADFPNIFPKFAGARASARLTWEQGHDEDGEPTGTYYSAKVSIPVKCRLAAIVQDIDYFLPIGLNLISLAIYFRIF